MQLEIPREIQNLMVKKGFKNTAFKSNYNWGSDTIDSRYLDDKELTVIKDICKKPKFNEDIENRRLIRGIDNIFDIARQSKTHSLAKPLID